MQSAVDAGILTVAQLSKLPRINLSTLLTRKELDGLLERPVEVLGFSDEEGIRWVFLPADSHIVIV